MNSNTYNAEKKSVNILLVENSKLYTEMLMDSISNLGYEVKDVVNSGEAAIDLVSKHEEDYYNIILMDIGLDGELDGIEAAEQIKEFSSVPIIYLTAHTNELILERAKSTGPYSYIIKPVEQITLHINVEIALHNKQLTDKLYRAIKEKEYLIKEIDHRVKNNIQLINSFIKTQRMNSTNHEVINSLLDIEVRLNAINFVHDKLSNNGFNDIDAGEYFKDIIQAVTGQYAGDCQIDLRFDVDPNVFFSAKRIIPIGMAVNEILINSIKYAFPDKKGEVYFSLKNNDGVIELKIGDDGIGLQEGVKESTLGMQIIPSLIRQALGKSIRLPKAGEEGCHYSFTF